MSNRLTTFWNRLIPYCWEETLSGQQFIMGRQWWREVRRQTLMQEMSANSPIFVTFDEAEKFFSKIEGQEMGFSNTPSSRKWAMAGLPGYGKSYTAQ